MPNAAHTLMPAILPAHAPSLRRHVGLLVAVVAGHLLLLGLLWVPTRAPETPARVMTATVIIERPEPEGLRSSPPSQRALQAADARATASAHMARAETVHPARHDAADSPRPAPSTPTSQVSLTPVAGLVSAPTSAPQAAAEPRPTIMASGTAPAALGIAVDSLRSPPAAAAARVELPSADADHLANDKPPYPPLSRRLGEQGKVVLRVLIDVDGSATRVELRRSSGFERLDQAALQAVLRWRYVPGKRAGVAEAMWFDVPLSFVLE